MQTVRRRAVDGALAAAVCLLVVGPLVWTHLSAPDGRRLVDLEVYRDAGRSVLDGRSVYEHLTDAPQLLPFTYPPLAAVLAVPLAWVPFGMLGFLWTALTLVLLAGVVVHAFGPALRSAGPGLPVAAGVLTAAMAWMLPLRDTVKFGQVNLVLLALVLADCTARRPRWPRGVLIGIAAAVKLTPAIFVPYLWLSGRRTAALTAAGTAAVLTVLAAGVLPAASVDFWTGALFDTDRLRDNAGTANQSLRGMLLRLDLPDALRTVLWLALVAGVAVVGLRRAAAAARDGDALAGTALTGLLAVLLSPVAWNHHLVWVVLVVAVLARPPFDARRLAAAVAVWLFYVLPVPWVGQNRLRDGWPPEALWTAVQDGFGLVALLLVWVLPWRRATSAAEPEPTGPHARRA